MAARTPQRSPNKPKTQSRRKVNPSKPAPGQGMFAVRGDAAKRLDSSQQWGTYPSGPLPFTGQVNGDSVVTPERLWFYKLTRFNPIRQLKPEVLSHYLDLFQQGYLRYFDLLADAIEHRDPVLMTVIPKRKAAVKRLRWDVVVQENLEPGQEAEAEAQRAALYDFYNRATCTEAVDLNVKKGMPHLFDRMMECRGHKYSHFEIVWQPGADGSLTARFNWIPLWFFETRTGKSRFLLMDYGLDGEPLKDGSWLVTVGEGLMEPCAVNYMFKNLCLRDLLIYCDVCAAGGVVGKTDSPYGSDQYNAVVDVVKKISVGFGGVLNLKDELEKLDFSASGNLPWMPLVDYCDRAMATLWRGADLSTISGRTTQGGQGALLQGKEEYNLQCADAQMITEALNTQIDPLVVKWHFGEDAKPLAFFKLIVPPSIEATTDIAIVNAMLSWGVDDIGVKQMHEHFGIGKMGEDDKPLQSMAQMIGKGGAAGAGAINPERSYMGELEAADEMSAANQRALAVFATAKLKGLLAKAREALAEETAEALSPLRDSVNEASRQPDATLMSGVRELRKKVPDIVLAINKDPANATALRRAMTSAWFAGLTGVKA